MARIAVITGDLIDSTRASDAAAFRARLAVLLENIKDRFAALTTMYRGDGFQIALPDQVNAFAVALLLRSGLIASSPDKRERWDARMAIAFGTGPLTSADQSSDAYVNSGRSLDAMGKAHLCVHGEDELTRLALETTTLFVDDIMDQLSPAGAEALYCYLLHDESHQLIAERLGKKRVTVTQALNRAKYTLLDKYMKNMDHLVRIGRNNA